jgi:hypothetical protein
MAHQLQRTVRRCQQLPEVDGFSVATCPLLTPSRRGASARRHETAVENAKKSSTAMSTGQVKSGNLFHAINETAQEN